jgi:hypothetical protein
MGLQICRHEHEDSSCLPMLRGLRVPRDGGASHSPLAPGSPGKGAKTDQNVWPLPRFNNFHQHECFDDSRFCQIFSFGGNYEISVETILVETILVETNIFWWKLILFGGN